MAPLTEVQLRVDKWSKLTLVGSTLLFVVSLMTFLASHNPHHRGHPHHPSEESPEHEGGRIRLHHFAILGLITSFTGVASTFKLNRGWAVAFLILVLITEISALGFVGFMNSQAAKVCVARSMGDAEPVAISAKVMPQQQQQPVLIAAAEQRTVMKLPNGQVVEQDVIEIEVANNNNNKKSKSHSRSQEKKMFGHGGPHHRRHRDFDQQPESLGECLSHVRHAGVISSLIVGVIACSLACCGSRYSNSLAEREEEEHIEQVTSCAANNNTTSSKSEDVLMAIVVPTSSSSIKEQPATIVA